MDRQLFRNTLASTKVKVVFTKRDGTRRTMNCTLRSDIAIPHEKTTEKVKKLNEDVCAVWDIDKGAWRSFRYDSVIEYRPYNG